MKYFQLTLSLKHASRCRVSRDAHASTLTLTSLFFSCHKYKHFFGSYIYLFSRINVGKYLQCMLKQFYLTSCFGADILSKLIENLLNMCYVLWTRWNDLCCLFIYLFFYFLIYLINNNIYKTEHTDFNSWWILYVCKLKKLLKSWKNPWSVKIWGKWHRRIDCELNSFSV